MSSAEGLDGHVAGGWPSIGWEDIDWTPSISPDQVPRNVRERHSGPYRAAVVPQIANLHPQVPSQVAALADEATAESYGGFLRAAEEAGSIGLSVYDFATTSSDGWDILTEATGPP